MANSKKLTREERKSSKRTSRTALKKLYQGLSRKQRGQLREEKQGIKQFVAAQEKAAADKAAAKKAAEA